MFDEWKPKIETRDEKAFCEAAQDMATCCECGFTGKVIEFHAEIESEGWEYPDYTVHYCPKCEDGVAEDYFPSEESLARWYEANGEEGDE